MTLLMSEKRFKKFGSVEQYNNLLDYAFLNYDGTILQEGKLKKGETPVYSGETPTKPDAGQYRYEFYRVESGNPPSKARPIGYKLLEKKEGKEINMATFDRYGDGIIKLFCWFFKFPSGMLGIYGYNVPSSGYNLSTSNQRIWLSDVADPGYNPIDGGALLDMEMINGEEQSSSGIFPNKMFGISYDGSIGFYPIRPFKNLS